MLPLTEADQQWLLALARRALEEKILSWQSPVSTPISRTLGLPSGAFVTLHEGSSLRGCIGLIEAVTPLYQTVRECAVSAALYDPRFDPVTAEEIPRLKIEISVLSLLEDAHPEEVEAGRHGLLISQGARRGLLLPQVAANWGWDRIRFLQETCLKASLPQDAWRQGARIQIFTAQVFSERETAAAGLPAIRYFAREHGI